VYPKKYGCCVLIGDLLDILIINQDATPFFSLQRRSVNFGPCSLHIQDIVAWLAESRQLSPFRWVPADPGGTELRRHGS
jgi:hypothetical protein